MATESLAEIIAQFPISGSFLTAQPIVSGHINRTFRLDYQADDGQQKSYLLQQVNDYVFKDVPAVMANIQQLASSLENMERKAGRFRTEILRPQLTVNHENYYRAPDGTFWRVYNYIAGGVELKTPTAAELAGGAWAFGSFAADLAALPSENFVETIPNFHHLPKRYQDFTAALAVAPGERLAAVEPILIELEYLARAAFLLAQALDRGELPRRLAHNDTKLSNILFKSDTHEPLAIVDLDTVMPGSPLYDFGDLVRSAAASRREDEPEGMELDRTRYEIIEKNFYQPLQGVLTANEFTFLPLAPLAITAELALRFFSDYLQGDRYFTISYENHNFNRGLAQFYLARSMWRYLDERFG